MRSIIAILLVSNSAILLATDEGIKRQAAHKLGAHHMVFQSLSDDLNGVRLKSMESIDKMIESDEGNIAKSGRASSLVGGDSSTDFSGSPADTVMGGSLHSALMTKSRKDRLASQQRDDDESSAEFMHGQSIIIPGHTADIYAEHGRMEAEPLVEDKLLKEKQKQQLEADKLFEAQQKLAQEKQIVQSEARALREARITITKEEAAVEDAKKLETLSRWQEGEAAKTLDRARLEEKREEGSMSGSHRALEAERRERAALTQALKHTLEQKRAEARKLTIESEELQTARSRLESIARLERRQPRQELEHNLEVKGGFVAGGFALGILMACCWRRGKYDSQRLAQYT